MNWLVIPNASPALAPVPRCNIMPTTFPFSRLYIGLPLARGPAPLSISIRCGPRPSITSVYPAICPTEVMGTGVLSGNPVKAMGVPSGCIAISNTTGTICLRGVARVHTARSNSFVLMHRLRKNRKNSTSRLAAPSFQPRVGRYKAGSGHGSARFGSSIASRT